MFVVLLSSLLVRPSDTPKGGTDLKGGTYLVLLLPLLEELHPDMVRFHETLGSAFGPLVARKKPK